MDERLEVVPWQPDAVEPIGSIRFGAQSERFPVARGGPARLLHLEHVLVAQAGSGHLGSRDGVLPLAVLAMLLWLGSLINEPIDL